MIPSSTLAVTGCRCTNPGDPKDCPGHVAIFDFGTGEVEVLPAGKHAEGIAVTAAGDVWVGALKDNTVSIFGFGGRAKHVSNFRLVAGPLSVPSPMRLAYDRASDTVAVASLNLAMTLEQAKSKQVPIDNLFSFDANTRQLRQKISLSTSKRGLVNMEGLYAANGLIFAPGFDSAAVAVVDAASLVIVAEVYFPRCTLPEGFCTPTSQSNWEIARDQGEGGWNNWSGGTCAATMRNPYDRRFAVLDGMDWSPKTPAWAE
jgi:hypothetical protein